MARPIVNFLAAVMLVQSYTDKLKKHNLSKSCYLIATQT